MANKDKSKNLPQFKIKDGREMYDSELEYESNQDINLSLPECAEMNAQVDPLKDPKPVLIVGASDESTKYNLKTQSHGKNVGSESGEKQNLVLNLKDKGGISVCGNDNSKVLRSLKEGVSEIAKACASHEFGEEQKLPDNRSSSVCTTWEDAETCCEDCSTENRVEICDSRKDLVPVCIKVMEGCNSCSHISKGSSREPTSNSETQTVNQISRATVTDTNTSTHLTCSSQTTMQDKRNRSAQTSQTVAQGQMNSSVQISCVQVTQECQITPDYRTTSCQTSIPNSNNIRRIVIKPWAARKYQDMCMCAELGAPCTCANRKAPSLGMVLPRNSSCWPTVKKTLLIIAALVPWVFLIVYSIYYYRANY